MSNVKANTKKAKRDKYTWLPCPLPINSLTSILKSCKISGHLLLRDSKDPLVAASNPVLKSGSWKVKDAVRSAESELAFQTIRGPPQFGRAGLGTTKSEGMPAKRTHQYRKLVSVTSKEIDEESNMRKALQLQLQGQCTRWENYVKNDLSWKSLLAMPANLLSFCLASTSCSQILFCPFYLLLQPLLELGSKSTSLSSGLSDVIKAARYDLLIHYLIS